MLIVLREASSRFLLRDCSQFLLREDCSHTAHALLSPNGHLWVLKFKLLLRKNNGVNKPTSQLDHRYIRSDAPTGRRSSTMYLMHHPTSVEVHTHRASSPILAFESCTEYIPRHPYSVMHKLGHSPASLHFRGDVVTAYCALSAITRGTICSRDNPFSIEHKSAAFKPVCLMPFYLI